VQGAEETPVGGDGGKVDFQFRHLKSLKQALLFWKKKQKTFAPLEPGVWNAWDLKRIKVFLLLFLQKKKCLLNAPDRNPRTG
jgi:hypothetical protein